jgi:hypothetical protein
MTSPQPRKRTRLRIVILVVLAALLISAAIYALSIEERAPSIQIPTSVVSGEDASLGLMLGLHISTNATGSLLVSANETNILSRVNNVTTANDWPLLDINSYPCGNYNQFPIQYAVFQGSYDLSNYSSGVSLTLYNPAAVYLCPTESNPGPYLLFAPLSDNMSYRFPSGDLGSYPVSAVYSLLGYWTGSQSSSAFHHFSSGFYTVLVENEWGNIVLLHFEVGSTSMLIQTVEVHNTVSVSGLGLCASNCGYPAPYASALVTFNASVPVSSLAVYVNNTYDGLAFENPGTTTVACTASEGQICSVQLGGSGYSSGTFTTITRYYATCSVPANSTTCSATNTGTLNTLTVFGDEYQGSVPSSLMPVIPGDTYVFTFVATFQDGSTAIATVSTVAS